jgi:hypothetical protein
MSAHRTGLREPGHGLTRLELMDAADEIRALYREVCCATLDLRLARLQAIGRFISLFGRPPSDGEIADVIAGQSIDGRITKEQLSTMKRPQRRRADFALSMRGLKTGRSSRRAGSGNRMQQ